ncbi:MAG TPA: KpsF/GutQ family sugar-phosphate isomerase [Alphaproteobacteria bacterium]|nr:KpsF/GutQ family sugar-phosphate isomerase [Alphaproteobacteria bacterium]
MIRVNPRSPQAKKPQLVQKPGSEPENTAVGIGRRVLTQESRALAAVAAQLDGRFARAVELLLALDGRAVVTGMGKSGHVARKIAATLSSTGTPALFVHPGEASHGDLGMITKADAVLALSNSGEAAELNDIVAYTRRFAIPLVSITGTEENSLARAADLALVLPPEPEACPMGLAPTTSTTMMIALGDALAVALMERRGFGRDDYRVFHPGGRLGRVLIKVSAVMHGPDRLPLVTPDRPMSEAIIVMSEKQFGCVAVVDGSGDLVGIITDGDLRRHMGPDLVSARVETVMTRNPKTIGPDALAAEALAAMNLSDHPFTAILVTEAGRPIGIVSVHDLLRAGVM